MERQPVLGAPKASRTQPIVADDVPAGPRLPLRLMALGVILLIGSGIVVGLTLSPLTQSQVPAPTGANALRIDQRAVAVAYVDVQGGVRSLSPTLPGRVRSLPVPEGKEVPAGTVLLQLDDDQARADLARAELDHDASQVLLTQALELEGQRTREIESADLEREIVHPQERIEGLDRVIGLRILESSEHQQQLSPVANRGLAQRIGQFAPAFRSIAWHLLREKFAGVLRAVRR